MKALSETPIENARISACCGLEFPWETVLDKRLPLYGHRNWIVIADSAYPAQARERIETVLSSDDPFDVVRRTLEKIRSSSHVKPSVVVDQELELIAENDAPGVSA